MAEPLISSGDEHLLDNVELIEDDKTGLAEDGSAVIDATTGEILPDAPDARLADADEDDPEDPESGSEADRPGESLEQKRARRREEKKEQKRRHKAAQEAKDRKLVEQDRTIRELTQRTAVLERRTSVGDIARLDSAIEKAVFHAGLARREMQDALASQNAPAFDQAQQNWYEHQRQADGLKETKARFEQAQQREVQQQPQQQVQRPRVDPVVKQRAQEWMEDNDWFDPEGGDEDSEIASAIDKSMTKQGFDAKTDDYWDEFDRRLRRRLPHLYKDDAPAPRDRTPNNVQRQRTGGSGRESGAGKPGSPKNFRLSAERVALMKEAGKWEDPKERARTIKYYMDFDKANPPQQANGR